MVHQRQIQITYRDHMFHVFRRRVELNPVSDIKLLVASEHCDNGQCTSCNERRRFVTEALAKSGTKYAWDDKREVLTFPSTSSKTIEEAVEFLKTALPDANIVAIGG